MTIFITLQHLFPVSTFQIHNTTNSEDYGKDKIDSSEFHPFPSFKPSLKCPLSNSCTLTESRLSFSKIYLRQLNGSPFQSFKWSMTVRALELRMSSVLNLSFPLHVFFLPIFVANSMQMKFITVGKRMYFCCKPFKRT